MKFRYFILAALLLFSFLKAEYIVGNMVSDIKFVDTNVDSSGVVVYDSLSTRDLISSGKVIVISFFGVG